MLDYTAPNIVNIASSSLTAIESVQTTNENRGLCQVDVGTDSASASISAATDYDTYVASFTVYSDEGDTEAYGEFTGDYLLFTDADAWFSGAGSGLPYGAFFGHDMALTLTVSASDTYYKITGLTLQESNLVTENSDAFRVNKVGMYLITYSVSAHVGGSNNVGLEVSVHLGSAAKTSSNCLQTVAPLFVNVFSGSTILDVTSTTDDIDLRIKNITNTEDIIIGECNMTIVHVGGT